MGKEIVYCEICGERILEQEFEKGRAVTVLNKNYCVKCKGEAVKSISSTDLEREGKAKSSRSSAVLRSVPRETSSRPKSTSVRPATPPRAPAPHRPPLPHPSGSKVPLVVGGAVGAVAIVVLVVLLVVGRGSGGDRKSDGSSGEGQDPAARAEKAWQELQADLEKARKDDAPDAALARIEAARPALAGSKYASQIDGIKSEFERKKKVVELWTQAKRAAEEDSTFERYPEVLAKFEAAESEAARSATSRLPEIVKAKKVYTDQYEAKATEYYDGIKDQVQQHMRDKEWEPAMKVIDSEERFPKRFRHSQVWKSTIQRWYKECEARRRG